MAMSRSKGPRSRGTDTVTSDSATNPATTASAGHVRRSRMRSTTPAVPASTSSGNVNRVAPRNRGSRPSTYSASNAWKPGTSNMVAAPLAARRSTDVGSSRIPSTARPVR